MLWKSISPVYSHKLRHIMEFTQTALLHFLRLYFRYTFLSGGDAFQQFMLTGSWESIRSPASSSSLKSNMLQKNAVMIFDSSLANRIPRQGWRPVPQPTNA